MSIEAPKRSAQEIGVREAWDIIDTDLPPMRENAWRPHPGYIVAGVLVVIGVLGSLFAATGPRAERINEFNQSVMEASTDSTASKKVASADKVERRRRAPRASSKAGARKSPAKITRGTSSGQVISDSKKTASREINRNTSPRNNQSNLPDTTVAYLLSALETVDREENHRTSDREETGGRTVIKPPMTELIEEPKSRVHELDIEEYSQELAEIIDEAGITSAALMSEGFGEFYESQSISTEDTTRAGRSDTRVESNPARMPSIDDTGIDEFGRRAPAQRRSFRESGLKSERHEPEPTEPGMALWPEKKKLYYEIPSESTVVVTMKTKPSADSRIPLLGDPPEFE